MTKEDYMHLPKERLAEMLAERDKFTLPSYPSYPVLPTYPVIQTIPCWAEGGHCSNPFHDCVNCPRNNGFGTTITTTTQAEAK